ncbi:hypothetical protein IGI04_034491, partial [Brassica rapa subsp. trilocularis]
MAKNLSSVTFTVLLLVLLMASTEILKIEAMNIKARCLPQGCKNATFSEECGPEPFTGSNNDCCHCCVAKYGREAVCKGVIEGPDKHCHCYKERMPSTGCKNATFSEECGPEPFTGSNNDCCHCCIARYGRNAVCKGVVELPDKHCHCYKER